MSLVLLLFATLGHGLFWAGVLNRLHSFPFSRRTINRVNKVVIGCGVVLPLLIAAWLIQRGGLLLGNGLWEANPFADESHLAADIAAWSYLGLCWAAAAIGVVVWMARLRRPTTAANVQRSTVSRLSRRATDHFLTRWPGNQSLQVEVIEREIELPRLPPALDGLTIAHLTDLHYTGRLGKAFFAEVADCCQATGADIIAITGDLLDTMECLDWLPDTLGRLHAPAGVYWIRGNHEIKVDTARLREVLNACGLTCLSGRWLQVPTAAAGVKGSGPCFRPPSPRESNIDQPKNGPAPVRCTPVVLAGNELPWFPPAADMAGCPPPPEGPLRILLAHSPDQLPWARANGFDLMLAGHVHGGQVRVPGMGAILSPSRHGVKYSCGLFVRPPTVMNVSRGVSAEWPLRYFCRPEITKLVLREP